MVYTKQMSIKSLVALSLVIFTIARLCLWGLENIFLGFRVIKILIEKNKFFQNLFCEKITFIELVKNL